jgi:putative ABC transport system permease protein
MRRFFLRLLSLVRGRHLEDELAREIDAHLVLIQDDLQRRGLSPEEARLEARRTYGGVEQAKELHREARSFLWVEQLFKDARYGCRGLLRTPMFTLVAVTTLALGIGANTALFSVVNAVLLQPLAYRDADQLVTLLHYGNAPVSVANFLDWRQQSNSFQAMAAAEYWSPDLTGSGTPEHLLGLRVTRNLLPMLGIKPLLGRTFAEADDRTPPPSEIVLSHRLWQRRFSADPAILNKTITLNGAIYTVVGVMPPEFRFAPFWATRAELWVPLGLGERMHARGGNSLRVFARLKANVALTQARAEVAALTARLEQQFPGTNREVIVTPLKEKVVGKVQTPLLLLLGACGFVLLIACANVAHMLLARTSGRQKEIAVRTAMGAGRARLMGQFLTENLLLALLGAALGLLLALWGTNALVKLGPAFLPRLETIAIDARVVVFLLGTTMLTAIVFGLAPTLHYSSSNLIDALKEGGRGGSDGASRNRFRAFLVTSEFALAFVLLIGAGLTMRSFAALQAVDPGFDPRNLLTMVVSVTGSREALPERRAVFYRQLLEQVQALPGVRSVSATNHLPLAGDLWGWNFEIQGRPKPKPGESPMAVYRLALPQYFETMRLPILRGRPITAQDIAQAPGAVVINERAAAEYWPGQDPLGQRISFDADAPQPTWLTVVGVSKNAKQGDWASQPDPEVYLSALQNKRFMGGVESHDSYLTLLVRTEGNPADLTTAVQQTVWSFNRNLPISAVLTMERVVADATAQFRFQMLMFALFAGVALILAVVGIYGVMNYTIARRTREIGIRMSLGATRSAVLGMVLRQAMRQALAGTVAGLAGALLLSRLVEGLLFGVKSNDPVTFAGGAALLTAAALIASAIPARKASRIEPTIALRAE